MTGKYRNRLRMLPYFSPETRYTAVIIALVEDPSGYSMLMLFSRILHLGLAQSYRRRLFNLNTFLS